MPDSPDSSGSERMCTVCLRVTDRLYGGEGKYLAQCFECWTVCEQVWEVERDRFGVMFSGPLEIGECVRVVPESRLQEAERQLAEARKALSDIGWSARWHLPWDPEERLKRISEKTSTALSALRSGETAG
jgi:hypothetical protein